MGISFSILQLFPPHLAIAINNIIIENNVTPEELRVRVGQAPAIRACNNEYICCDTIVTDLDMRHIILNATNGAFHIALHKIRNGYLPLPNGCRLGICGEGNIANGEICNIKHINSICIRIANPIIGCADSFFTDIVNDSIKNTIIIAPPGAGKTTLLREIIRNCSYNGFYVAVADEREEISGMSRGVPSFDLGPRTDVITGIPKESAALMLIRAMSPNVLAMDEITASRDMPAIIDAFGCGVGLVTTIHGIGPSDLMKPSFRPIFDLNIFDYAISISTANGSRKYVLEKLHD